MCFHIHFVWFSVEIDKTELVYNLISLLNKKKLVIGKANFPPLLYSFNDTNFFHVNWNNELMILTIILVLHIYFFMNSTRTFLNM